MALLVPPILDIFVVWHPDEIGGSERMAQLQAHFHGPAYSGLAGGAVEVYGRSDPWEVGGSPRPIDFDTSEETGVPAAQFKVIVPILGANLARAVTDDTGWANYIRDIAAHHEVDGTVVFPVRVAGFNLAGTPLGELIGGPQILPPASWDDPKVFVRELCQAIAQWILRNSGESERIRVFVSHTKYRSLVEKDELDGAVIYERVRQEILGTRLDNFFDAQSIQTGDDWDPVLEDQAATSALLMIRTDNYAGREWTQKEVFAAKRHGMPVVCMYSLTGGEDRGSFLMDHVPTVPCDISNPGPGINSALGRLVDECLKRALWMAQSQYVEAHGFDWAPTRAPEPVTLAPWLAKHKAENPDDDHVWIIHPDPPLGPREREVLEELCALAGFDEDVDVLTPRTFAIRGGKMGS